MNEHTPVEITVSADNAGGRLDALLVQHFSEFSRAHLQRAIRAGGILVDGKPAKASHRLREGEQVTVAELATPQEGPEPEDIPLDVLYEDDWLVAINKPPRMVVHPAKGHWSGTLTAALAFHFRQLSQVGGTERPGIVHRLDRDTSGVIVVAKTDPAHHALAKQFAERTTEKEYFAIVAGCPDRDRDVISQPIGVHPHQREKMAIRAGHPTSREAETFYEVIERFTGFAAVRAIPKTGRTHQIRVHLAHIGCPVLCDPLYGGRSQITHAELVRDSDDESAILDRTALHARRLKIAHPQTGESLELTAEIPADIEAVLSALRAQDKTR